MVTQPPRSDMALKASQEPAGAPLSLEVFGGAESPSRAFYGLPRSSLGYEALLMPCDFSTPRLRFGYQKTGSTGHG
jgi:hypothetical protein